MHTPMPTFSKSERNKLRKVVKIMRENFAHHVEAAGSAHGYLNNHGGCGNCGDQSGFYGTIADLELLVGLRKP